MKTQKTPGFLRHLITVLFVLGGFCWAAETSAQPTMAQKPAVQKVTVAVEAGDTPVRLVASLDSQGTGATFTRSFRVKIEGTDAPDTSVRAKKGWTYPGQKPDVASGANPYENPKVLTGSAGALIGGEQEIVLSFTTINGITLPGEYKGKIDVYVKGVPSGSPATTPKIESDPCVVDVVITLKARPALKFPSVAIPMRTVHPVAPFGVDTLSIEYLLPGLRTEPTVTVTNSGQGSVTLPPQVTLVFNGAKTGDYHEIPLSLTEQPLAVGKTFPLSLKNAKINDLSPDRYTGTLTMQVVDGPPEPFVYGFTLDVRDGPFWPFVLILFGVFAGRKVQRVSSPLRQAQFRLLDRLNQLEAGVATLRDTAVASSILRRLRETRQAVIGMRDASGEGPLGTNLDEYFTAFLLARSLEALPSPLPGDLNQTASDARLALVSLILPTAKTEIDKIYDALALRVNAQDDENAGSPILLQPVPPLPAGWGASSGALSEGGKSPNLLQKGLASLTDTDLNTDYRWWQPTLQALLLALLIATGFYTLYVAGRPDFGSNVLWDYLSLVVWGLSAEVAQKTLQNLPRTIPA